MIALYIDTTSNYLYTAIYKDGNIASEIKEKMNNDLSSFALPKISEMFEKTNINIKDIDKIIVVNGPGSFTGIRIGLTIGKTLAWALKKDIIQISSLEAMAISNNRECDFIVPVIDARRNYVYGTIYDISNKQFVMNEKHILLPTLEVALENLSGSCVFISNDDIKTEYEIEKYIPNIKKIIEETINRKPINPHAVDANYLKLTEAEENKIKEEK